MKKTIMVAIVSGLFSVSAYAAPPLTVASITAAIKQNTETCMPPDAATVKKVEVKNITEIKKAFRGIHIPNPGGASDTYVIVHSAGPAGKDTVVLGPLEKGLTPANFKPLIGAKSCAPGG